MISSKHFEIIENTIGYRFRDRSLLAQAFTRTSYCNEKNYGGRNDFSSSEVLEFFGDSVLSTAIVTLLLRTNTSRYTHGIKTGLTEGDFSNIRSKLSDKRNLSRSMAKLGLQKFMLLGEGDEKLSINEEPSVMEDLFESIIGAVYIDSEMNIETVISVVEKMLDVSAYGNAAEAPIQSYKNALQEWCADKKHRLPTPVYKTISESGPDHKKTYERGVYLGDRLVGVGNGKNQKLADSAAAEAALCALKAESNEQKHAEHAKVAAGAAKVLRELASAKKLPSPEYHDLGEAPESTETRKVYLVECCFAGKSAVAKGYSKQEARDISCAELIKLIDEESKPKKSAAKSPVKSKVKEKSGILTVRIKANPAEAQLAHKPKRKAPSKSSEKIGRSLKTSPSPKREPGHHTKRS